MNAKSIMLAALLALSGGAAAAQEDAPAFRLRDVSGAEHTLAQYAGKIVVLEWTNYRCPFVRKFYGPGAMQALQKKYTDKGVIWLTVCSSAPGKQGHFSPEEWTREIKAADSRATAVLMDEDGAAGRAYGASNTPHIFVVAPDGTLAYQGAIDDQRTADPASVGKGRNHLAEALDALLGGEAVPTPETKAYGCSVKY